MPRRFSFFPKICVCSSGNPDDFIDAIKQNLQEEDVDPTFETVNYFDIYSGSLALERTVKKVMDCDFAILIFTPDDIVFVNEYSNNQSNTPRDKINFMMGLLSGILGLSRIFYVSPHQSTVHILSHQKELINGYFKPDQMDFQAALRVFTNKVLRAMKILDIRDKQPFSQASEDLIMLHSHYRIKILNEEGDGIISRTLTVEAKSSHVNSCSHIIFSDNSEVEYDELSITARNEQAEEMGVEKIFDAPSRKIFKILFRNAISKGDQLTYTYELLWKKMFPKEASYFSLKNAARKTIFSLILPKDWDLLHINAVNKRWDEVQSDKKAVLIKGPEFPANGFVERQYEVQELGMSMMETHLSWIWQSKTQAL